MSQAEKKLFDASRLYVQEHYDGILYRNNSGALKDTNGTLVRFGLGNDSKQVNEVLKSSDSIGGVQVTVTPDMVGRKLLVLCAFEDKAPGWKLRPSDKRGLAQHNFIMEIIDHGGIAGFITDVTHISYHVQEFLKNGKR